MDDILRKIKKIPNIEIKEFMELFQDGNSEFLEQCKIVTLKPDFRFVVSGEDISKIWILLKGYVKALEEFNTGETFIFKRFPAPEVFGEMEALADIDKYRATLITDTECVFLNLPVEEYKKILKNNPSYLYKRTNIILKRVLDEKKHMRTFLMVKSIDRIKIYFVQQYKLYGKPNSTCVLKITRQQISEETGYSVKTINRGIKKLEEENLLIVEGQKIIITNNQYRQMLKSVDSLVDY